MHAILHAKDVPVIDSFTLLGPSSTPAKVSFKFQLWAQGPAMQLGSGTAVPADDPAAFLGKFFEAQAEGSASGLELGFSFTSNLLTSNFDGGLFAMLGTERNGAFL